MTRLFRSKSCGPGTNSSLSLYPNNDHVEGAEEEEEEEQEDDEEDEEEEEGEYGESSPVTTPFISPEHRKQSQSQSNSNNNHQFPILEFIMAALRKSLVCSVERDDVGPLDIGWPTDVRHVSHVTFDRFNGFLGLPVELQPEVPRKVPSASASVFGVSAKSMQCSYDHRGNSVPTILLMMQKRLYSEGGLQAEGIFRINAENSQEQNVRDRLNKGIVPRGIDVHCLAGLIKAWFRELPRGVLDSLTPEQVMHCNTEEDCTQLVQLLPQTEAALLDWAINLMADVVQHEHINKMNARNIAMVFAPNMTQMADPLTALIHAVQVMNFLKTLIMKIIREREESGATVRLLSSVIHSPGNRGDHASSYPVRVMSSRQNFDASAWGGLSTNKFVRSATFGRLHFDSKNKFWSFERKSCAVEEHKPISDRSQPVLCNRGTLEHGCRSGYDNVEVEGILDRLSWRKGVRKLCSHPVFQLNKPVKKSGGLGIVNGRDGDEEAWA